MSHPLAFVDPRSWSSLLLVSRWLCYLMNWGGLLLTAQLPHYHYFDYSPRSFPLARLGRSGGILLLFLPLDRMLGVLFVCLIAISCYTLQPVMNLACDAPFLSDRPPPRACADFSQKGERPREVVFDGWTIQQ
jgi:hypothetical protein